MLLSHTQNMYIWIKKFNQNRILSQVNENICCRWILDNNDKMTSFNAMLQYPSMYDLLHDTDWCILSEMISHKAFLKYSHCEKIIISYK